MGCLLLTLQRLQVIKVIDNEAVPLLKRCSLAGHAQLKTSNPLFGEHPQAADMLIDILTDRGFSVAHSVDEHVIPVCLLHIPVFLLPCIRPTCGSFSCHLYGRRDL